MNEVERNKLLFLLLTKLVCEKDLLSIRLIQTFVVNDTDSIKKTFEIMSKNFITHT